MDTYFIQLILVLRDRLARVTEVETAVALGTLYLLLLCARHLYLVFHEILKLHQEVPYEQAISKYFSEFPSVDANTLRGWVAELDRATSGNSKSSVVDETKESVHCHQLFNVQITTIHQRIDQQTNELKSMANKLRNRLNEDRAFERDMNSGAAGRGGRGDDFERVPFKNQVNSRDPRNQDKEIQPQAPPKPQNSRWQQDEKVAEPAPQPAGSADDQNWQRSTKKPVCILRYACFRS